MKRNWIIYGIALLIAFSAFIASNTPTALGAVLLIAITPVASIAFGRLSAAKTTIHITSQESCTADQEAELVIEIRRSPLFRGRVELEFAAHNLVHDTTWTIPVTLVPSSYRTERFTLPLRTDNCGRIMLKLASAFVIDNLGFAKSRLSCAFESAHTVYPHIYDLEIQTSRTSYASDTGVEFDPTRRGQDKTEVFDLRDFHDGDSLKSVHWKLSARTEDLMVREASHPADYDIALILGMRDCDADDKTQTTMLNAAFSLTASVSMALLRQGVGHCIIYSNGDTLGAEAVDGRASFNGMLDTLMSAPLPNTAFASKTAFDEVRRTHSITKSVMVTSQAHPAMAQALSRYTALTILNIGSDALGIQRENGWLLVNVPVADIGTNIKNLEL